MAPDDEAEIEELDRRDRPARSASTRAWPTRCSRSSTPVVGHRPGRRRAASASRSDLLEASLGAERAAGDAWSGSQTSMAGQPFEFLQQADARQVISLLSGEHPQTIALVLAHLRPEHASAILAGLEPDLQADVAHRIALMERASPDVVARRSPTSLQRKASTVLAPARAGRRSAACSRWSRSSTAPTPTTEKLILEGLDEPRRGAGRGGPQPDVRVRRHRRCSRTARCSWCCARSRPPSWPWRSRASPRRCATRCSRNLSERARENLVEEIDLLGPVRLVAGRGGPRRDRPGRSAGSRRAAQIVHPPRRGETSTLRDAASTPCLLGRARVTGARAVATALRPAVPRRARATRVRESARAAGFAAGFAAGPREAAAPRAAGGRAGRRRSSRRRRRRARPRCPPRARRARRRGRAGVRRRTRPGAGRRRRRSCTPAPCELAPAVLGVELAAAERPRRAALRPRAAPPHRRRDARPSGCTRATSTTLRAAAPTLPDGVAARRRPRAGPGDAVRQHARRVPRRAHPGAALDRAPGGAARMTAHLRRAPRSRLGRRARRRRARGGRHGAVRRRPLDRGRRRRVPPWASLVTGRRPDGDVPAEVVAAQPRRRPLHAARRTRSACAPGMPVRPPGPRCACRSAPACSAACSTGSAARSTAAARCARRLGAEVHGTPPHPLTARPRRRRRSTSACACSTPSSPSAAASASACSPAPASASRACCR